jgi:hypothetical protein
MTFFAFFPSRTAIAGLAVLITGLAGCASTSGPARQTPVAVRAAPAVAPSSDLGDDGLRAAMGLLYTGDATGARKRLIGVLKRHPGDPTATSLIRQIDTDPQVLLARESFAYRSRPGDTVSLLAERFLGDPILFYALARYNHLQTAGELPPGLVLRIPGHEAPEPHVAREPAEPRAVQATAKPVEPHPAPANNPQRARQLRAAGLEQLDRGAIDHAVALFQQAAKLDPGNALIQRDLDRALRISRAVHARS